MFININGVLDISWWYNHVVINDRLPVTSNNRNNNTHNHNNNENIRVENREISYYIVERQPPNHIFLSCDSVIGHKLDDLKLDIYAFCQD